MAECGSCKLCCKLLGVGDLDPPKPNDEWCPHCNLKTTGGGCTIHDHSPQSCQDFECQWRVSDGHPSMRPDRLHLVVAGESRKLDAYVIHVDPAYPLAYKDKRAAAMIKALRARSHHRNVLIICGEKRFLMTNDLRNVRRVADLLAP